MASQQNNSTTTFPQFARLPTELRRAIWNLSLPNQVTPHMFPFRSTRCRALKHSHLRADLPEPEAQAKVDAAMYEGGVLDECELELPLAFVNHEAREVVLHWAREGKITLRDPEPDRKSPGVLLRSFNLEEDAIYVNHSEGLHSFYLNVTHIRHHPDCNMSHQVPIRKFVRLAIPFHSVKWELWPITTVLTCCPALRELIVILDRPFKDREWMPRRLRWEIEICHSRWFDWKAGNGVFRTESNAEVGLENVNVELRVQDAAFADLSRILADEDNPWTKALRSDDFPSFKIRYAFVGRCHGVEKWPVRNESSQS